MSKSKKKNQRPVTIDQWAEITHKDGKTVTTLYPPNKELEHLRLEMDPPPVLVYRRMNFVHGVPAEYIWTEPSPQAQMYGGMFLQRLSIQDWLEISKAERLTQSEHIIPPDHTQPRPPELGPCPCDVCTQRRQQENRDN